MHIDVLTIFPEMVQYPFNHSMMKRAIDKGKLSLGVHNIRDYSTNKHKSVDDAPYGGGAGMVMMCEPIVLCIDELKASRTYDEIIYVTPDGEPFNQSMANQLSSSQNIM
ncbi:MAG: tRNA (guanosine(37)-N1)-methyltransferase TrmD, partial [Bacteroidetes bacterium]|nr:tRNA (guanosine(37)-N1)-methyltransferase TrmD [Bacteroidota bacterium]